jgi:hypothetical protein
MAKRSVDELRKLLQCVHKRDKKLYKNELLIAKRLRKQNGRFGRIWNAYKFLLWLDIDTEKKTREVSREAFLAELASLDQIFNEEINNSKNKENANARVNTIEYYITDVIKLTSDRWKTLREVWEKIREERSGIEKKEEEIYLAYQSYVDQNKDADEKIISERTDLVAEQSWELINSEEKLLSEEETMFPEFESIIQLREKLYVMAKNRFKR